MGRKLAAALALCTGIANVAFAQSPSTPADTPDAHLALAKAAARFDFLGTLGRLCVLP